MKKVSVVGLGKLGAPLAAVFAAKGHKVVGVDLNEHFVDCIRRGVAPVEEPRLQEMLDAGRANLTATTSFDEAIAATDITCIIVPTPSDEQGVFSNVYVLSAIESVGRALRAKSTYHVVVVTSTVMPGSCDSLMAPALERASGRKLGVDVGLCYSPEFIALGSVVWNLLNPDMVLVGESDPRAGDLLAGLMRESCDNEPPIQRMSLVNAELTKISVNTYVTTKISYANMLAEICDRLPGGDVDVVTAALGMDSRIGRKYLTGATGYGGPCFPRDNVAFSRMARDLGAAPLLAEATDAVNNRQVARLAAMVEAVLPEGGTVAVLGMAYKPNTPVVEESHGVKIAAHLAAAKRQVVAHDPLALAAAAEVLGGKVRLEPNVADAIAAADVVIITTPCKEYAQLDAQPFLKGGRRRVVIDCWRILNADVAGLLNVRYPGRNQAVTERSLSAAEV